MRQSKHPTIKPTATTWEIWHSLWTLTILLREYSTPFRIQSAPAPIMDVDAANNPLDYYDAIIGYLYPHKKNANLKFARLEYKAYYNLLMNNYLVENADIYTVELIDDQSKNFSDRVLSFTVNGSKYVLDSVIMRDEAYVSLLCDDYVRGRRVWLRRCEHVSP